MISDIGKYGELQTAIFLRKKKWNIIAGNYSCRFGEIDLIASDGKYLAFIEVKTRDENAYGLPREFVDKMKQDRIIKTAKHFLLNFQSDLQPRFDVVEVYMKHNSIIRINHMENAFEWREAL